MLCIGNTGRETMDKRTDRRGDTLREPRIRPDRQQQWDALTPEEKERHLKKIRTMNVIKYLVVALQIAAIFYYSKVAMDMKDKRQRQAELDYERMQAEGITQAQLDEMKLEQFQFSLYDPLDNPDAPVGSEHRDAGRDYEIDLGRGVTLEMVWIPPGYFDMGSTQSSDEQPVHRVQLDGFWLGRYEVTNAQYRRFDYRHHTKKFHSQDFDGDDQPASRISPEEAEGFCAWLSRKTGNTFALPTEAQWEYACRAGSVGDAYWPAGDSVCTSANVADQSIDGAFPGWRMTSQVDCKDGFAGTAPVGSFPPNPWELYDMIGNVDEICADRYDWDFYSRPMASSKNPSGPIEELADRGRVARGGSWAGFPSDWRSASRTQLISDFQLGPFQGFRVCRNATPRKGADEVMSTVKQTGDNETQD